VSDETKHIDALLKANRDCEPGGKALEIEHIDMTGFEYRCGSIHGWLKAELDVGEVALCLDRITGYFVVANEPEGWRKEENRKKREADWSEENLKAWVADCVHYRGAVLVGKFSHWCFDWDFKVLP
jgi:hypothetical protein